MLHDDLCASHKEHACNCPCAALLKQSAKEDICIEGRPRAIITDVVRTVGGTYHVRFDSHEDLGFWLQVTFTVEQLNKLAEAYA